MGTMRRCAPDAAERQNQTRTVHHRSADSCSSPSGWAAMRRCRRSPSRTPEKHVAHYHYPEGAPYDARAKTQPRQVFAQRAQASAERDDEQRGAATPEDAAKRVVVRRPGPETWCSGDHVHDTDLNRRLLVHLYYSYHQDTHAPNAGRGRHRRTGMLFFIAHDDTRAGIWPCTGRSPHVWRGCSPTFGSTSSAAASFGRTPT